MILELDIVYYSTALVLKTYASSTDYADLIEKLDSDLKKISEWLAINKLKHHPTRMKVIIIGSTQNLNEKVRDSPVMLNGKMISTTDSFECSGVIHVIDIKGLLWDKHIDKICKKSGIAVMRRIKPLCPY